MQILFQFLSIKYTTFSIQIVYIRLGLLSDPTYFKEKVKRIQILENLAPWLTRSGIASCPGDEKNHEELISEKEIIKSEPLCKFDAEDQDCYDTRYS